MPNKAVSKKQFRFLHGVASGSIKDASLSPEKAQEMLGHQSSKGLPEKARKRRSSSDRSPWSDSPKELLK